MEEHAVALVERVDLASAWDSDVWMRQNEFSEPLSASISPVSI